MIGFALFAALFLAAAAGPAAAATTTPVTDRAYFETAAGMLRNAEKSVRLTLSQVRRYERFPDSNANRLLAKVLAARERGVPVEVCLDYSAHLPENTIGNLEVGRWLAEAGIPVYLSPADRTMHAKILLVDEKLTLLGSTNWSHYSLDRNREANLLVDCEETGRFFGRYFEAVRDESLLLSAPGRKAPGQAPGPRLDPNRATAQELATLPGIGPALAAAIVEAGRDRTFTRPADLLEVPGIGPAKLEAILPFLYFDAPAEKP